MADDADTHDAPDHDEEKIDMAEEDDQEVSKEVDKKDEPKEHKPRSKKKLSWQVLWQWALANKKLSIPGAAVLLVLVLAGLPFTRYALAGMVLSQDFSVVVMDVDTKKPVSSMTVTVAGKSAATDSKGHVKIHAKVGNSTLTATKKYYTTKSVSVLVPIGSQKQPLQVDVKATGRQVPITVTNKISGKPVANLVITALGTEAKTDKDGLATVVLPADKTTAVAAIAGEGYNKTEVTVVVTDQTVKQNSFTVTPAGKVYFLSNLSGKIDVVKTNLDGTNRQTVLAGTGKEELNNTSLLAATDWHYLALLSKRDGGDYAKLFLLDTSSDQLTTMDEGKAIFRVIGWSGHHFLYQVDRSPTVSAWQNNQFAIKSYNAENAKITVADQSQSIGTEANYAYQSFQYPFIVGNSLVYVVDWYSNYADLTGKQEAIRSVQVDGTNKKDLKTFNAVQSYWDAVPAEVETVYYLHQDNFTPHYYEYEGGAVKDLTISQNDFYNTTYKNYLYSPSGQLTFWSDGRDGKNTLLVGDKDTKNEKTVATLSNYTVSGWYTDDYLLVGKNGSELYIMPVAGIANDGQALKVTDYRPSYNNYGYHGGY